MKKRFIFYTVIKIIVIILLLIFILAFNLNAQSIDTITNISSNKTIINWFEFISLLAAPTGIFGLWAKYTLDRKDRVKTDREATSKIIEKIELNDMEQNKKIGIIEEKMNILLEAEEINLSVKALKLTLEQTTSGILDGVEENNIKETVSYGVSNATAIFSGVVLQDFKLDVDNLELQLKVAVNKITHFNSNDVKLSGQNLVVFKKKLHDKLTMLVGEFIMEIYSTFKKSNGSRREEFMRKANEFIKKCIIQSIIMYRELFLKSK